MRMLLIVLLLMLPSPVHADEHKDSPWVVAGLGAFVMASGMDSFSTGYALASGDVHEANPVARWAIATNPAAASAVKVGVAAGTAFVLYKLHVRNPKAVGITAWALAGFTAGIAEHNMAVARRAGPR